MEYKGIGRTRRTKKWSYYRAYCSVRQTDGYWLMGGLRFVVLSGGMTWFASSEWVVEQVEGAIQIRSGLANRRKARIGFLAKSFAKRDCWLCLQWLCWLCAVLLLG